MKVSYKKLWVMLAEREMSKVELRKLAGIAPATFTKLRKNQEVALSILMKIADVLDCYAGDIVSFIRESDADENVPKELAYRVQSKKDRNGYWLS